MCSLSSSLFLYTNTALEFTNAPTLPHLHQPAPQNTGLVLLFVCVLLLTKIMYFVRLHHFNLLTELPSLNQCFNDILSSLNKGCFKNLPHQLCTSMSYEAAFEDIHGPLNNVPSNKKKNLSHSEWAWFLFSFRHICFLLKFLLYQSVCICLLCKILQILLRQHV